MHKEGIMVAVGAVIEDESGRILLVRHLPERGGFWQGRWICPGGRLETGEEIGQGIKREVREETDLEIRLTTPLIPFERIVKERGRTRLHVIYIDYLAKVISGELSPGGDIGEAVWVDKKDIPGIWQELHDDTKRLLKIAQVV